MAYRFVFILGFLALLMSPLAQAQETAKFTVDVRLDEPGIVALSVLLECEGGTALSVNSEVSAGESVTFSIPVLAPPRTTCRVTAVTITGKQFRFAGDGGSPVELSERGCLFTDVKRGHSNFCQIHIENKQTTITVYKKWIGTSEQEKSTDVFLDCVKAGPFEQMKLNDETPATWELELDGPEGVFCDVSEQESEAYNADVEDCQGLLILPGSQEECMIVNTKVVKMIEMLNRYGLVLMILVFMAVGMFAARKAMI